MKSVDWNRTLKQQGTKAESDILFVWCLKEHSLLANLKPEASNPHMCKTVNPSQNNCTS